MDQQVEKLEFQEDTTTTTVPKIEVCSKDGGEEAPIEVDTKHPPIVKLAEEPLTQLLSLVDYYDVCRLKACGNKLLYLKVSLYGRDLHCPVNPLNVFPFSAFEMPKIRSFEVTHSRFANVLVLDLQNRPFKLFKRIETLQKLSLNFFHALGILMDSYNNLDFLFPNLTSLELHGFANYFLTPTFYRLLPRRLTNLSLSSNPLSNPIPFSSISKLPKTLTNLSLKDIAIIYDEDDNRKKWGWPQNLQRVSINRFHVPGKLNNMTALPLESVSIAFPTCPSIPVPTPEPLFVAKLPRTLTTLNLIVARNPWFHVVVDGAFPPKLKQVPHEFIAAWNEMPRMPNLIETIVTVPPYWIEQCKRHKAVISNDHFLNLKTLSITTQEDANFWKGKTMPKNLTSLTIGPGLVVPVWKPVPSLTEFNCQSAIKLDIIRLLPKSLKTLGLAFNHSNQLLSSHWMRYLPKDIRHVNFYVDGLPEGVDLKPLKRLKKLESFRTNFLSIAQLENPNLLDHLSPTIKTFDIIAKKREMVNQRWIGGFSKFQLLESLALRITSFGPDTSWYRHSPFESLSKTSLTNIELTLGPLLGIPDSDELFKHFPSTLKSFCLQSGGRDATEENEWINIRRRPDPSPIWQDDNFSSLPSKLDLFAISFDYRHGITAEILESVPNRAWFAYANLSGAHYGQNRKYLRSFREAAIRYYENDARWAEYQGTF